MGRNLRNSAFHRVRRFPGISSNLVKSRKIATHQNHALISTSHHAMNRTPLGPINGNKTHRKELTPFTRGFILGKLTSGVIPP